MKYFILAATFLFTFSCTQKKDIDQHSDEIIAEWPNAVMYEIFIQSFADSNGDGIGDINGMIDKLDYLQDLGIRGVWLMPIMPSPSYHKYDVTDYFDIHPDYGTMDDFKRFLEEAHKRDIKVVIDMIINHTSNQHPWFLDSKSGKDSEYRDYFVWMTNEEIQKFSSMQKEKTGDSYNITQWHDAEGNDEKFYGFFTGMMPDLNFDNPEVRDEVIEFARYWIEDIGVDGLRLDAARHIYEDSRVEDNQNWWREYRAALKDINPNVYLVGEVWEKTENIAPFLHGLPALFNFDLSFSIIESIKRGKSVSAYISGHSWEVDENTPLEAGYLKNQQIYQNETSDYQDAIFLSNHDQNRVLSALGGDIQKGKLAASILLTMPGTPYIYYGEEIGMLGMKPDPNIREPFLWNEKEKDQMRTKWISPEFTSDQTVTPLSTQLREENSIYHHYKNLIEFRNHSMPLTFGEFETAGYSNGSLLSYYRIHDDQQLLIIHNISDQMAIVQLKPEDEIFNTLEFSTNHEKLIKNGVDLKPYSSIILTKN
jgi:alpha-amylase